MLGISNFLKKFIVIQKNSEDIFLNILKTIKEFTGVELNKSHIEIKGDNLYFKIKPAVKNAIFLKKDSIESSFKNNKIFLKIK